MKDFPLNFHTEAPAMHAAATCAMNVGGDDKYWEVSDYIFATPGIAKGLGDKGARDFFVKQAADWDIDVDKFETCINSQEVKDEITADIQEGTKSGVSGTPALFIGNSFVPGAIGADTFQQYIDTAKAQ